MTKYLIIAYKILQNSNMIFKKDIKLTMRNYSL